MANNKTDNNDDFETVEDIFPEPWKDMDEGDSIIGKYLGTGQINGSNDKMFTIYKLRNDDNELISVSGASLEARMQSIPVGTRLKITFKGTEKSKHGSGMKMFDVQAPKGTKYIQV